MASLHPVRKPVFLWQAVLILLPVLIIAAVALTAIVESRTAVEREARRRAEDVARQYGKELERPWGNLVAQQDRYSQRWSDYLVYMVGGWPGSEPRAQMEAEAAKSPALNPKAELADWQAQYPGLQPEGVFPDRFGLTTAGRFRGGPEFNPAPQPPAWYTGLSLGQRAAWDALNTAASSGASLPEIEQRIAQFQETAPEKEAEMNAAFLSLRVQLATLPPTEAVALALRSAQEYRNTLSEAGLPLANLAFGEALRCARATGPSQELWDAIPAQVLHAPSPLIPRLLAQLEQIAGTDQALRASVAAWRTLWDARLKLHDIAAAVRQTGKLRGLTTANVWVEHGGTRWLCLLTPSQSSRFTAANGSLNEATNELWTLVRFLPKAVAERALLRALENSEVKLPAYLGISAWLEGEPLELPERWSRSQTTNTAPLLLAEANGALSAPARMRKSEGEPEVEREMLPSRPRFVLQLYVADPALMFASYRRHVMLLAGVVAASALAAFVGVVASWRAFQRQLHLNELKSNFVSSVSHELRAPIASVRLMAESLERGKVPEAPRQREYFNFIVQECYRLSALIENVLDFSRIEQGRKQYDLEPTDLTALTRQTVELMEVYGAERGVKLHVQIPDSEPPIQACVDAKAIQQALVNLIDNALKHSPKEGTVTVGLDAQNTAGTGYATRTPQPAARIHLWVEDHGEGIPEVEQERIFERFYRRGPELRRQTQGVGIGLSIVKHIVEAHGGRVVLRSALGQGSRFTIELPASPAEEKGES